MNVTRRQALQGALAGGAAAAAAARAKAQDMSYPEDPRDVVRLWPGPPPGSPRMLPREAVVERATDASYRDRAVTGIGVPLMTVFRAPSPNGGAVLIVPGGGYIRVVIDKEGFEAARRLNAAGITAFVLRYRLPGEGWAQRQDASLQDVQRAMRIIRARSAQWGVDPARLGVMGFSAGGHVAASLLTRHDANVYAAVDGADRQPARPDFAALMYPVISMSRPHAHTGSRAALVGADASPELEAAYSPDRNVRPGAPPTFLLHATDDPAVPVENSLMMYAALRAAKTPIEMHVFEEGGHGFGIRLAQGKPVAVWPELVLRWMSAHGVMSPRSL